MTPSRIGVPGLSSKISKLKPSATLKVTAKAKEMAASGLDIISLGAGEPDYPTPENVKAAAIKAVEENFTYYTPVSGIFELKKAVAKKLREFNDLTYDPRNICVSCGGKQSIYNVLLALTDPKDEVLIPVPYWVSYPAQVLLVGGTPKYVQTDEDYKLKADLIEDKLNERCKVLILNYPSNPTGMTYSLKELNEIADVVLEHKIMVVSDEVYEYFTYDGIQHRSLASLGEEIYKRTVTISSLSKTYSMTGWRIGYAACSDELVEAISSIQSHSTSNPNSIAQKASLEALLGPQDYIVEMIRAFDERRKFIIGRINEIDGIECARPEGAFYIFPDISKFDLSPSEFSTRLLDEGLVATVPGEAFGSNRNIRISYAASMEDLREAMDRLDHFCHKSS